MGVSHKMRSPAKAPLLQSPAKAVAAKRERGQASSASTPSTTASTPSPSRAAQLPKAVAVRREQALAPAPAPSRPTQLPKGTVRDLLAVACSVLSSSHLWLLVAAAALLLRLRQLLPLWARAGLAVWLLAESAFFVWKCRAYHRIQRAIPVAERTLKGSAWSTQTAWSRQVFERTLDIVDECASWKAGRSAQEWIETWFLGRPFATLLRGNLEQWMAWAFFTKKWKELEDEEKESIDGMMSDLKERYGWNLPEGFDPKVRPIRLNFDPMTVTCHPLCYYAVFVGMRLATRAFLRCMGFTYVTPATGLAYFHYAPARPGPAQRSGAPPIVFIHGMGAGLTAYIPFLWRLIVSPRREGFALELPEIAQAGCISVLPPDTFAGAVGEMLAAHKHKQACFVAHSYGTFAVSWIQRERSDLVAQAILMDPVCFHLAQPDVAYNFAYQTPRSLFSATITTFVRRELFAANVLMRNFYWQQNILWREELPEKCVVMLSGHDAILNAQFVRQYLEGADRSSGQGPEVLFFDGFFHAALVLSRRAQLMIVERT